MKTKEKTTGGSLLELVVIVVVALGLALGIQAFLVKPYRIPSESMVPTLEVGQRVLVNRIGNRFADPKIGDVVVFHPPKGSDDDTCGDGAKKRGQACDRPTSQRADVNFIKRVVAGPGDTLYVKDGHVYRNGKREKDSYINGACTGDGRGCNFTTPDHHPRRSLVHDGRQPWRVRRQPLLGPGSSQMDHRRGVRDLLAAQAHRSAVAVDPSAERRPTPPRRPRGSIRRSARYGDGRRDRRRRRARGAAHRHPGPRCDHSARFVRRGSAAEAAPKRHTGRRLFQFDRSLGVRWIAGADEAGRGCLAGPLVAAAVLFDVDALGVREVRALTALNDSKQHDPEARDELYPVVLRTAAMVNVVSRCVRGIDARGLHNTNLAALRDALAGVARPGCLCLVDGFAVPEFGHEQRPIVDGDATSAAIAAASILAKVTRDRFMHRADALHPGWEFRSHVGYSTPEHRDAIQRQGVSPLHRLSFQSTAYQQLAL